VKLKILELSNGNKLVSALSKDVLINDNGEIKVLSPSFELASKLKIQALPFDYNQEMLVSYVLSNNAKAIVSLLTKQYKGEVKIITDFSNVLLLRGITRSLREENKISPKGKTIYKSTSFIGYK